MAGRLAFRRRALAGAPTGLLAGALLAACGPVLNERGPEPARR